MWVGGKVRGEGRKMRGKAYMHIAHLSNDTIWSWDTQFGQPSCAYKTATHFTHQWSQSEPEHFYEDHTVTSRKSFHKTNWVLEVQVRCKGRKKGEGGGYEVHVLCTVPRPFQILPLLPSSINR